MIKIPHLRLSKQFWTFLALVWSKPVGVSVSVSVKNAYKVDLGRTFLKILSYIPLFNINNCSETVSFTIIKPKKMFKGWISGKINRNNVSKVDL